MPVPTVVFDFDGTIALGDGPVRAYLRHVADDAADPGLVEVADAALRAVAAGDDGYRDAYDAVRQVALSRGITEDRLQASYLKSRLDLGTPAAPVQAPAGLATFLTGLSAHARLVLATNAPQTGIDRALSWLGVADQLPTRHCGLGKPAGLVPVLTGYLADGPVLAVGDIWDYDLAPAATLGADTALVGATATTAPVHPTMRGTTLADLYGEITTWAATAVPGPTVPSGTDHPYERHD